VQATGSEQLELTKRVKCWLINARTDTLAFCIPKLARLNLRIEPGDQFRVLLDLRRRRLIYEKLG